MLFIRKLIFCSLFIFIVPFGFADQCPDMSQNAEIPSGWKIYGGKAGTSNIFYKAQWYQGIMRGMLCWYKTNTGSVYAFILESERINLEPEFALWNGPFGQPCDKTTLYCECTGFSAEACLFHPSSHRPIVANPTE